jgi:hypothetical protein
MTIATGRPERSAQVTNPLAVTTLVCGMVALVLSPIAILAIVLGHIARRQIRGTAEGGRGAATAGLALGYAVVVAGAALLAVFLASAA